MARRIFKFVKDCMPYQAGKTYFWDDRANGTNEGNRYVRRGFAVPADAEAPKAKPPKPAKALGDEEGDDSELKELKAMAKELGVPNYWAMKADTLEAAITERISEEE